MVLEKVEYTDGVTTIDAKNLNDIQDAIIELQETIDGVSELIGGEA